MSDSTPAKRVSPPSGRPLFLLVGLAITMLFGIAGWMSGCQTMEEYRAPADSFEQQVESIPSADDRAVARATFDSYVSAMDDAKKRVFPLAVAQFLLGAAMLTLTTRAFGGRAGARSMLVQVTAAQALLLVLAYFLTADARAAWLTYLGIMESLVIPKDSVERIMLRPAAVTALASAVWSTWVFVRTMLSVMAIILLTRRRTIAFFDLIRT